MLFRSLGGQDRETINSIKYTAPKAFSSQGRAVTKEDYISLIQQNNSGLTFDAVNVWGGEENAAPSYGKVFVSVKPTGAYTLTDVQKQTLINDVISPISVLTVKPTLVEPDYTYIQVTADVVYDPKKTNLTASQIQQLTSNTIQSFATTTLNTFNSTFLLSDLSNQIKLQDASIVTNQVSIRLQKKFNPILTTSQESYTLDYSTPLQRGAVLSGISSSPAMQFLNPANSSQVIDGVYLEELPVYTGGIESVSIINPGYNYSKTPTVTILGDGVGATAVATLNASGAITKITVTNAGTGYTSAVVKITNATGDTSGIQASAVAILQGQYGTIRSYYVTSDSAKQILYNNVGTIDYVNGVIQLNCFNLVNVDNALGQLTVTVTPQSTILYSNYNKILTVDPFDPNAIVVNVTAKTK
mgnify:CR=1 FL=1